MPDAKPTCGNCRWWRGKSVFGRPEDKTLGECVWMRHGDAVFPLTDTSDWCGEHAPREAKDAHSDT